MRSVAIVALFTIVPLAVLMWRQVRRGRWENADASNRAERPILYIVGGIALVALLAYLLLVRSQSFMVRGVVATLGMMAVCAAATRWIKVSLHMAFATLAATALALMRSPVGYVLLLALPALAWSRLTLERHTPLEVALGTIIGAGAGAAIPLFVTAERVHIRPGAAADEPEFLAAVERSRRASPSVGAGAGHAGGVSRLLVQARGSPRRRGVLHLARRAARAGRRRQSQRDRSRLFRSAYLGYYAFVPYAGRGLMKDGLAQVITHAFKTMKLHRLEANIQPGNLPSKALVKKLGFRREGLSPRYLKINGRWRDHERWAILSEDW